jgi:hypothetical protein
LAGSEHALLVDSQTAFDSVLDHHPPEAVAWDRIHPTLAGHMLLARIFLQALEFDWS